MERFWIRRRTFTPNLSLLTQAPTLTQNIPPQVPATTDASVKTEDAPLKFTSVMNNLQQIYPKQAMDDISTSYCFICLLHLANEKGLTINNEPGLEDLTIKRDPTAVIVEGG